MEELTSTQSHLLAMAHAITALDAAGSQFTSDALAPGHAAYFAWLTERATQTLSRLQIQAADAVQRSGSHQLDTESLDALTKAGTDPSDEQLIALHGHCTLGRASYKDAADLHSGWLGIPHGAAVARLNAAGSLIAAVTESGQRTEPDCLQLADEFAGQSTDPRPLIRAAHAICKATPDLATPQVRRELETQALELIKAEDAASAGKHLNALITEHIQAQRPAAALFAEAGLFSRGMQRGLMVYLLKVFPHEAEIIESLRAKTNNPHTIAGNRVLLNELTQANYAAANRQGADPTDPADPTDSAVPTAAIESDEPSNAAPEPPSSPRIPKEWDDASTMPQWAREAQATEPDAPETPQPYTDPDIEPAALPPFEDLSPALRHMTALLAVLRANRVGGKDPGAALVAPQVIVHLNYEKMLAGALSFATTENGLPLTAAAARTLMCNAGIYPVVLNGKSQPLDIGRSKRLFPPHMRRALAARDRGCIYPGCHMPAGRCEADHVDPWEQGGETRVDRGALLCPMHHHARHAGLFSLIVADGKPPAVLLPKFLDPDQQPRRNTHWFSAAEVLAA
ncbi:HNH endonuclease signature motif containing protein [Glutamicibacter sp.]|uniref:HNH endonuclease signature motif containing protein n=1 Tax=Glutamicibacter sp. TaxID=1931995 RepID=UPI002B49E41D|nr:DUF222 domain-containing protein [Glutamicibacter sp.]HJX78396.1 DUF222 domain-containing protein [Glutamicibacter sp.]